MRGGESGGLRPRTCAPVVPLLAVCSLLSLRLGLGVVSVPPWQNPDEPQHVLAVYNAGVDGASSSSLAEAERQIVASMAAHDWWPLNGAPTPDPVPVSFLEGPNLVRGSMGLPGGGGAYYRGVASTASLLGVRSPHAVMYVARCVSALLGLLTLLLAWNAARDTLGTSAAVGITGLMALHPQLCLVWTTASPDALIIYCGTVAFWGGVRLPHASRPVVSIGAILLAAGLAAASRRLGLVVLPMAACALMLGLLRRAQSGRPALLPLLATAALVGALATAATWLAADVVDRAVAEANELLTRRLVAQPVWPFVSGIHQSAWLTAGWLMFAPAQEWLAAAALLAVVCVAGMVVELAHPNSPDVRGILVLGALFVLIQFAAIYLGYYRTGLGAQGRYLYPAAAAFFQGLWLGGTALLPSAVRPSTGATLILAMATFDAMAWSSVIWPAFLE